jgi:hypothetical protein
MPAVIVIVLTTLIAAFLFGTVWVALLMRRIFQPLRRPAGTTQQPTQFVLADILVLMVLLQPGLSLLLIGPSGDRGCRLTAVVLISAAVVIGWRSGIQTLTSCGVVNTSRRVVYLTLAAPLAVAAGLSAVGVLVTLTVALFWDLMLRELSTLTGVMPTVLVLLGISGATFIFAGLLIRWVAQPLRGDQS